MNIKQVKAFLGVATFLLGAGSFINNAEAGKPSYLETKTTSPAKERTVLYWYDPTMPAKHFDKQGISPYTHISGKSPFVFVQLVPKYADDDEMKQKPASSSGTFGPHNAFHR